MNILQYTVKKFNFLSSLEKVASNGSMGPMGKNILESIDDDKKGLQEIIDMCKIALAKTIKAEVTDEIFHQYSFEIIVKKIENDNINLEGCRLSS